jgi:pimeloyl-ACP methyl ester carboxylesterase
MPALAEAGYRAVAPWMRGYAPSSVPVDGTYQTGALAADANALHEALGGDADAVLIGHDWGAIAGYPAVNHQPERWRAAVTMAVPHPAAMAAFILDYDQLKRSFYMFVFQHPLAEAIVQQDDLAFIDRLWADWSPGLAPDVAADAVAHVKEALRDPANLAAALGYYRATLGGIGLDPRFAEIEAAAANPVEVPLLYLHGADDGCIDAGFAEAGRGFLAHPSSRTTTVADAGHFLQLEQPEQVNAEVLRFLERLGS